MHLLDAYQMLKKLEPTFSTKEATEMLNVSENNASLILSRLEKKHTIVRLSRGRWAYSSSIDPLLLPSVLTYPMMAYISLYSALYYHGMIEQIPSTIFAITNGKTKLFKTPIATVSIHSINSHLFTGYESAGNSSILMATPEKCLFDTLYLMPAKSNIFKRLTEIELPDKFNFKLFNIWLKLVNNKSRKSSIISHLKFLKQ